jgi:selenide,water dikinase
VGNESSDDAAVLELPGGDCLVSTVDFFTPIVDNAFDFGRIAAANAVSDVYAMGGKPVLATAILGFPVDKLPAELAGKILEGAREICDQAGIPLAGGHSIDIPEPVFGLSVNGIVRKEFLKRNNTACAGDLLFLTKPLGIGILSSAAKRGVASEEETRRSVETMTQLNDCGPELAAIRGVHAMTDVTGFGLLGHLLEMCEGSGLSAEIRLSRLRHLEGALSHRERFVFPDNTYRNWNAYEKKVKGINGPEFISLCDPQTSGGLLVAVSPDAAEAVVEVLRRHSLNNHTEPIGSFSAAGPAGVTVTE